MPFIRYLRDRRGYETTYVMHAYRGGAGPQRARILYLYRSPATAKIGRTALDPEAVEALEHMHPDLVFDWDSLLRDAGATRPERAGEWPRRSRSGAAGAQRRPRAEGPRPSRRGDEARPAATAPETPEAAQPVVEDQTLLGRTLGAGEAARLRSRYGALVDRITRRARSPEERDRLLERAARLNPDGWADEAGIRSTAAGVAAEWAAIAGELPPRRRGRRGGRRRRLAHPGEAHAGPDAAPEGEPGVAPEASGIMGESGEHNAEREDGGGVWPSDPGDVARDGRSVGAAGTAGAAGAPAALEPEPAGNDVPGGS